MITRLQVVQQLRNKFDYAEFTAACAVAGVEPLDILEYAQKLGILEMAVALYPEKKPSDAYLTLIGYHTPSPDGVGYGDHTVVANAESGVPCGSCGGGRVI